MPLKDMEIRAFKPCAKDQKLFDGGGALPAGQA